MAIPPDLFRGNVRFALQPGRRATSSSIPPDLFRGKVRFALQPGRRATSSSIPPDLFRGKVRFALQLPDKRGFPLLRLAWS